MDVGSKNDFNWMTVILLAAFCILGSFGGGVSIRGLVEHHSGWGAAGLGVSAGIFIAISAVLIKQVLASLQDD
jgi:hypothetical protein